MYSGSGAPRAPGRGSAMWAGGLGGEDTMVVDIIMIYDYGYDYDYDYDYYYYLYYYC